MRIFLPCLENGKLVTKLALKYFYKKDYWRPKVTITIFILAKCIISTMNIWTQANKRIYKASYVLSIPPCPAEFGG